MVRFTCDCGSEVRRDRVQVVAQLSHSCRCALGHVTSVLLLVGRLRQTTVVAASTLP